jgi:predicted ATPase/DNA-binding CsgD family transcriptional regulator
VAERISEREAEVLAALGARLSNAQIANRLHISVRTVESHVSSLLRKYGVADRWALAKLARSGAREPGRIAGLPASGTTFVGRGPERAAVLAAIEEARLVTLLGPGGVGKTRLAAVVAEDAVALFPSGGAFVDLVPVREGFVARAVATALGVTEGSHQPLAEAVAARLGTGRSLLVLDNCEHVIDEAAEFAERILAACPATRALVTSRERLSIPGERSVPIAPLPLGSDAERLFHDRALAADPQFVAEPGVIAELCARLDGLPLAIELAAARGASLGATGLLAALEDALRLLSGVRGGDERHRSLRAVLSWSYNLLGEEEQTLFRRLGVFVGAFDIDAAAAVGGDRAGVADLLGRLADKSLVVHLRGRVSRWRLLETVRAFALAQMSAAGEEDKTKERLLRWAADAASAAEGRLSDPAWREDFDAMAADLRVALTASGGPGEVTHRLARALAHLTFARRHLLESFAHHRTAAAVAPSAASAARDLRAGAGCAHVSTTSNQHVYELLLQAAGQARRAGDERGRAIDLARAVETACRYPEAFETSVPHERLLGLLNDAVAAAAADDPQVAACVAVARAWLAGPDKGAPDPELASAAVAATRVTADPVLISSGLCAAGTALDAGGGVHNRAGLRDARGARNRCAVEVPCRGGGRRHARHRAGRAVRRRPPCHPQRTVRRRRIPRTQSLRHRRAAGPVPGVRAGGRRGAGRGGTAARRGGPTRGRRPARRGERLGDGLPRPCARTPAQRSRRAGSRTHGVGTPGRASGTGPHANVAGAALVTAAALASTPPTPPTCSCRG